MITKDGHRKIATAVRNLTVTLQDGQHEFVELPEVVKNLVLVLSLDNPRFNAKTFVEACSSQEERKR